RFRTRLMFILNRQDVSKLTPAYLWAAGGAIGLETTSPAHWFSNLIQLTSRVRAGQAISLWNNRQQGSRQLIRTALIWKNSFRNSVNWRIAYDRAAAQTRSNANTVRAN